jgi:5-methylcytosine-specific restriction endonuclease McrA
MTRFKPDSLHSSSLREYVMNEAPISLKDRQKSPVRLKTVGPSITDVQKEAKDDLPPWLNGNDFLALAKEKPEAEWEAEWKYRDGYLTGWLHCARAIVRLYKKGYVRPRDIASVLESHDETLRRWRDSAETEDPLTMGEPSFTAQSWGDLRRSVFERDGWACTDCGDAQNLEAHHVESVRGGGLSALGNLVTLCRQCHRGF